MDNMSCLKAFHTFVESVSNNPKKHPCGKDDCATAVINQFGYHKITFVFLVRKEKRISNFLA